MQCLSSSAQKACFENLPHIHDGTCTGGASSVTVNGFLAVVHIVAQPHLSCRKGWPNDLTLGQFLSQ